MPDFEILPGDFEFDRGFHREEMEGIRDIGGFREADDKSRQQFWMKYRGLKTLECQAKPERSYRPAQTATLDTVAAHKSEVRQHLMQM